MALGEEDTAPENAKIRTKDRWEWAYLEGSKNTLILNSLDVKSADFTWKNEHSEPMLMGVFG